MSGRRPLALRALGYWLFVYRRNWRAGLVSGILTPVLYLSAMGLGIGVLVRHSHGPVGGVSYLTFIAPGVLAANAMQTAAMEATYPVMASIKWFRTYHAMLATPLRVRDVLYGHLGWMLTRLLLVSSIFLAVMAAFGTVRSPWAALALPAAALTGTAFAAPLAAFSASIEKDAAFAYIFRFGIVPLFLFSGTFFPISQLPAVIRPLAYLTPLWHGVSLCRDLVLGEATVASAAVHVGYLVALTAIGTALAVRSYERRLTP